MPREQIVKEIAGGYGNPGTVPMAWSAARNTTMISLKPIAYDLDLAKQVHGKGRLRLLKECVRCARRQMKLGLSMRYLGYHAAAWRHPEVPPGGATEFKYFLRQRAASPSAASST